MKFSKKNTCMQQVDDNLSRKFTLGQYFAAVCALLSCVAVISYAATITQLNIFTDGQPISAQSVNNNFAYIQTNLDAINTSISNGAAAVRSVATGGTGANTAAVALANLGGVGAGQRWYDRTNSAAGFGSNQILRAANVNLVNNTARPIQLAIGVIYNGVSDLIEATLIVDGVAIGYIKGGGSAYALQVVTLTGMIPSGSTYQLAIVNGAINFWSEFS